MKKHYTLTGMSCGGCVNTVKQALLRIQGITEADVLLEPQSAVLTHSKPVDIIQLQAELSKSGHYTIREAGSIT